MADEDMDELEDFKIPLFDSESNERIQKNSPVCTNNSVDFKIPQFDWKSSNKRIQKNSPVWTNNSVKPVKEIICLFPEELLIKIRDMERQIISQLGGSLEFGLFLKGSFKNSNHFCVSCDYYIPKQTVTEASIDFKESEPEGFNGVLHRHPTGISSFSGTDDTYINSNYKFSLLYEGLTIKKAVINMQVEDFNLQVPMRVQIVNDRIPETFDLSKITKSNIVGLGIREKKPEITYNELYHHFQTLEDF